MKHEEKTFLDKALLFILGGIVVTLPLQVTKQLFPIYVFGSEFPILELSRLLIALGSVVLLVRAIRQRILIIPKNAVALAVYALVGLSIVSVLMYFSFSGLRELVRYGFHLAFFMFVVNTINDREERRFLWKCLIGSGLCVALFSIVQYFTGFYLWNTGLDDGVFRRVNATFHDPNVLASFMGLVILAATAYYSWSKSTKGRFFAAMSAITSLAALFYTFSRGGLVALVISLLALGVALPKNARNLFLYLSLIGVSAILTFTTLSIGDRLSDVYVIAIDSLSGVSALEGAGEYDSSPIVGSLSTVATEDQGVCLSRWETKPSARYHRIVDNIISVLPLNKDREAAVTAGIYMLIDNPVFGVGLGNFQSAYLSEYCHLIRIKNRSVSSGNPITLSHTSIITIAAEWGLVGILWFIFFVGSFSITVLKLWHATKGDPFVAAMATGMLFLLLNTQLRGGLFSDPYFWLLDGLLVFTANIENRAAT